MRTFFFLYAFSIAQAQTFEVASIKPAAPPQMGPGGRGTFRFASGGPGTNDPGRVHLPFTTLKILLMTAYDVKSFQITGPSWLDSERFDVQATMPPETTKEQYHVMLQNLIAERFAAKIHRETKELPMYSLVVAKGGPKMKESAPATPGEPDPPPPPPREPGPLKMAPDGFPILPGMANGRPGMFQIMMPGRARITAQGQMIAELATRLSMILNRPVSDLTELTAKYDFILTYSPEGLDNGMGPPPPPPPGSVAGGGRGPAEMPDLEPPPTIFAAIQSQLGLKLDAKKGPVQLIVVDKMEKVPTEN